MDRVPPHQPSHAHAELSALPRVDRGRGGLARSCRALVRLPWLWWCAGLALVLMVAGAGTPTISAPSADMASVDEHPVSASAVVQSDHHRPAADEHDALGVETNDEDELPDTLAISPASKLVRACGLRSRALSCGTAVDTGYWLISTGPARGPPAVG